MPSPFPGMDPYLEHPEFFPGLHDRLIAYLCEAIQVQLPRAYYADIRTRVWIETSERSIEPDVDILRSQRPSQKPPGNGGVAVRIPPVVITVPGEQMTESFID